MLNYFGQGALLLADPAAVRNPFYLLAPEWLLLPMIGLATLATVIASQAVITGAFSMTPRPSSWATSRACRSSTPPARSRADLHSADERALMLGVIFLILTFQSSANLAEAYGVAVTGTMLITSCLVSAVILLLWKWPRWIMVPLLIGFLLLVDVLYFSANAPKIFSGGSFPVIAVSSSSSC